MGTTTGSMTAVILAGSLRASPLADALNLPVLCLPVGPRRALLDVWLDLLADCDAVDQVRIVVNATGCPQAIINAVQSRQPGLKRNGCSMPTVEVISDPKPWRGPAGIVHDVIEQINEESAALVIAAHNLPPISFDPLLCAMCDGADGVVGMTDENEPAGVYVLSHRAISETPSIGFVDMKEQLLPALYEKSIRVTAATLGDHVWRIHDLQGYLQAITHLQLLQATNEKRNPVSIDATIAGSAIIDGHCMIEHGVIIEDSAIVQDSVVMAGASIGSGAVVSRSLVGPLATIEPDARIVRKIVTDHANINTASAGSRNRAQSATVLKQAG